MKFSFKKLPIPSIITAGVLAVLLLLFINAYSKKEAFSTFNLWGGKETNIESQIKDTDNDGLLDWEEELFGTDPLNLDTDGDNYLDGEEINSDHNPLIKGPNDHMAFFPLPIGDKYNITNKIFADFNAVIKSYIEQKNEYALDHPEITSVEEFLQETTETTLNELITRSLFANEGDWLSKAYEILVQMPEIFDINISDSDITIVQNSDIDSIKKYMLDLIAYLDSPDFILKDSNMLALKDGITNGNYSRINELIRINDYQISKLKYIETPFECAQIQKQALKVGILFRNIFMCLRGFETDPIKAAIAANEIINAYKQWDILTEQILNINKLKNLGLNI